MTPRMPALRSSRPSARRRSRCVVPDAVPTTLARDEVNLTRLMAAHLRRLAHTRWFAHPQACLGCCTQQLAEALAKACTSGSWADGGPQHPLAALGHTPHLFDAELREIWLVQLWHAFDDVQFPLAQRARFWTWAEALSVQLMAPHSGLQNLNRYPYATVQAWFADVAHA